MVRSFFQKLKDGLSKTHRNLTDKIKESIGLQPKFDPALFDDLEAALIAADCGLDLAVELTETTREACKRDNVGDSDGVIARLKQAMADVLRHSARPASGSIGRPQVTVFVGVNGAGKTTSIGKIGCHHARAGRSVIFAAADTFRAAAGEQLEIWAERAGAQIVASQHGADPAAVAYDAVAAAKARGVDVVLIDTAGRLQTKSNLMAELAKVRRSVDKALGNDAPKPEVLLVMDATTGQNGLSQAQEFTKAVGVDGIVLTKLDGTAKGGIVLAIAHTLKIPVAWVGVGEGIEDLETFDPDEFVEALFA
ncbi:MAG TPA: signal recognition particle-docking protein FtsY [bacterium]|nr:signal recognition particle-docking protein FtsY [bacterium]